MDRIGHTLAKTKNVQITFVDFWQLPSNGVIMKIAHRDLDLLFEGRKFEIFISQILNGKS